VTHPPCSPRLNIRIPIHLDTQIEVLESENVVILWFSSFLFWNYPPLTLEGGLIYLTYVSLRAESNLNEEYLRYCEMHVRWWWVCTENAYLFRLWIVPRREESNVNEGYLGYYKMHVDWWWVCPENAHHFQLWIVVPRRD